jgi:nucleotide-binding universal stress UspA family protein
MLHAVEPLSDFAKSLVELHVSHEDVKHQHAADRQLMINELRNRIREICNKQASAAEENLVDDILVLEGQPAQTIIKQAQRLNSDIIVMGTHKHSAVGEALLGSTAQKVLHAGTIPTLLVRVPEKEQILEKI